jgi:glyoxylate/hydroxypyruvate reductase
MGGSAIVIAMRDRQRATAWRDRLRELLPDTVILGNWEMVDNQTVAFAVVWKPGSRSFRAWPNLRGVLSIGAGIDDLIADASIPAGVAIIRMIDPGLTVGMREYVLLHVLRHHRLQMEIEADQRRKIWRPFDVPTADRRRVGVMGLGTLGLDAARHLAAIGFQVLGWKRTPADVPGIESFGGKGGLGAFLAASEILVCLLPLTEQTRGILGAETFARMPHGAQVINAGRGECLAEDDLLQALDSGQIRAATLDTFHAEPLPPDHPFWHHPKVTITPHTASLTSVESGSRHIAEAIQALDRGQRPPGWVDRTAGY